MATVDTVKKMFAMVFFKFPSRRPHTKEEGEIALKAWCKIYNRLPDDALIQAAERFYAETTKLYPDDDPFAMINRIANPTFTETEGDAVELAFEAASRFGRYKEKEAMAWIREKSKLVAAAVQRIGFLELCDSIQPDVIRGQLRAIFASEKSRAIEAGVVCDSATQLDDGINKKLLDFVTGFKVGGKSE
jgi:hypothetical protein